ncbi:hypothetical protein RchiOBHm_Chr2g0147851 [Rosa chinensis]|uniref:Uncharacterized protein n=1 Tax=Rosa chinensis TaxID=74649 RepID=A0A2P6RZA4_ROSCH|nr:hypothetical protein RchiOBHm_Chr2g0147851 [Rosa chinensis]
MQRSIWVVLLPVFLVWLVGVTWLCCCESESETERCATNVEVNYMLRHF